jgi:rhamnogalacturonan acetylesterase
MKFTSVVPLSCIALGTFALPEGLYSRAAPAIYLAGDSTMAAKGANNGVTDGRVPAGLLTRLDS